MKNKIVSILFAAFLMPASLVGQSHQAHYEIGTRPSMRPAERVGSEFSAGTIRINDIQVPAYGTEIEDPNEGSILRFAPQRGQRFTAAATSAQLQRLAAFFTDGGWMLVPRGWRLQKGRIGSNGSAAWVFVAPDGNGWLTYYNSAACVGCAQSSASPFFPEARRDAQENEMEFYTGTDVPIQSVRLRPNIIAYRASKNNRRFDGVVFYQNQGDTEHWHVEVTLPSQQQDLAQPILNRFVPRRSGNQR